MGKTTNALEKVIERYFQGSNALEELSKVRQIHMDLIDELFAPAEREVVYEKALNHFVEAEWVLEEAPKDSYDYVYDQVVSVGELVSTSIVAAYLEKIGVSTSWTDARGIIKTDNTFREGVVDWVETTKQVDLQVRPILGNQVVLTQGFIGSTDDNETTTLGREGSDFTGAILANILDACEQAIWKDVPGVLNADPRKFENTQQIHELSFNEAVEMTYYGASVIHPKTIKPLQNKGIPLIVRSFLDLSNPGTKVSQGGKKEIEVPVIIKKEDQILLNFRTKDFSFIGEDQIGVIMKAFGTHHIKINMIQNGAIRFAALVDNKADYIQLVEKELNDHFDIKAYDGLELLTIRHYNTEIIEEMTAGKEVLLEQKTAVNYQVVFR